MYKKLAEIDEEKVNHREKIKFYLNVLLHTLKNNCHEKFSEYFPHHREWFAFVSSKFFEYCEELDTLVNSFKDITDKKLIAKNIPKASKYGCVFTLWQNKTRTKDYLLSKYSDPKTSKKPLFEILFSK